jgi:hypothetical protein
MVPRYDWMYPFGKSVESVRPVLLHARQKRKHKNEISKILEAINDLRKSLNSSGN